MSENLIPLNRSKAERKLDANPGRSVTEKTGLKKSAIYSAIRAGTFPAPVPISERRVAWRESEVDAWIAARIAAAASPELAAKRAALAKSGADARWKKNAAVTA
jgi:prophage regulatory protein